LDYLLRDAHYTGVAYGVIDWGRIIAKIHYKSSQIQIGKGGLEAAESVILARFSMFHAVYYHHAVRISRKMLQSALSLALEGGEAAASLAQEGDNSLLERLAKIPSCSEYIRAINGRRMYKRAAVFEWGKLSESARDYAKSGDFEADLRKKFPKALADLPSNFKSQADIRITEGNGAKKLSVISSISSSLEAAAVQRATLLAICPAEQREPVGRLAKKLLSK
ncbi:MAG: hypothetical protein V1822_03520, partial [Candidatus Micrarchaeota archaeon]